MWATEVISPTQSTTLLGSEVVPQREVMGECENEGGALHGRIGEGGVSGGLARVVSVRWVLAKDAGGLGA